MIARARVSVSYLDWLVLSKASFIDYIGCEFAVTGDLLESLQHNTALVHGRKQTKLSVSERSLSFAQILFAHPIVSSQVVSSSSPTLLVIVEPHNSCTSLGMASDLAVLT